MGYTSYLNRRSPFSQCRSRQACRIRRCRCGIGCCCKHLNHNRHLLACVSTNTIVHRHVAQVLSFGRPPRALHLMSIDGGGGGAAAWQPHAVIGFGSNSGAAAESQTIPPPGAVPILAAVFDAAVHIRTLGKLTRALSSLVASHVYDTLCQTRTGIASFGSLSQAATT